MSRMIQIIPDDLAYIQRQAKELKIAPELLLAIVEVESNGVLFANVNGAMLPVIRWEGHYFDRLVPAGKRDAARKAGLASPKAGAIKNPATQVRRYAMLDKAVAIDPEAAYSSISIGVGQVMGNHAKDLGYASAEAMFNRAKEGLPGQIELVIRYIVANDLVDELQRLDFSGFARGYNGPNYTQNSYHTKLKAAYESYLGATSIVKSELTDMLRMGSKGARVREVQQLLVRAGYAIKVDGDFGPSTRDAVKEFQKAKKLKIDGIVGPKTYAELLTYKTSPDEVVGQPKPAEIPGVAPAGGLAGIGGVLIALKDNLFGGQYSFWITAAGVAILVIGAAWVLDAYQKSQKTYEGTK